MRMHPLQRFRNGVRKALNHVAVRLQIALGSEICRVRNLPALSADAGEDITLTVCLNLGRRRLKEGNIVAVAACESSCHHVKLDGRIHRGVLTRDHAVLPHDIFERHLRNAACPTADNRLAANLIPRKCSALSADQKGTVAFGHLRKNYRRIFLSLIQYIDACLRAAEADFRLAREHARHYLIRTAAVDELHLKPLFGEETLFQRHVLRRVKHRVRYLAERQANRFRRGGRFRTCLLRFLCCTADTGNHQRQRQHHCKQSFHSVTPILDFSPRSSRSTS